MLAKINPVALPALRIAGTFFLTVNILAFVCFFAIGIASSIKIRTLKAIFRLCGSFELR